jgi:hypothetical protein
MAIETLSSRRVPVFPRAEVEKRLRRELQRIADDAASLRAPWEPLLDSMRVVGVVLVIEDLFPWCRIAPDRVVQKGGYDSIDEGTKDITERIRQIVGQST